MAVAVASSASNTTSTSGQTLTITKPSGLSSGDLLYAFIAGEDAGDNSAIDLPSGWTNEENFHETNSLSYRAMYKVADSSDASATDFSFPLESGNDTVYGGILLRVTGFASNIITNDKITGEASLSGSTWTVSGTMDPLISDSLLLFAAVRIDASQTDFTNYAVTGGTNPTWTDIEQNSGSNIRIEIAHANYGSTTQITAASFDSDTDGASWTVLVDLPPQNDATGTHSLLEQNPVFFSATAGAGTTGTHSLLEGAVTIFSPASSTSSSPIWSNQSKPSTTWKNESSV